MLLHRRLGRRFLGFHLFLQLLLLLLRGRYYLLYLHILFLDLCYYSKYFLDFAFSVFDGERGLHYGFQEGFRKVLALREL